MKKHKLIHKLKIGAFHPKHIKTLRRILLVFVAIGTMVFLGWYINVYVYKFFASAGPVAVQMVTSKTEFDLAGKENEEFMVAFTVTQQNVSGVELSLTYDATYLQYGKEFTQNSSSGFIPAESNLFDLLLEEVKAVDARTKKVHIILVAPEKDPAQSNGNLVLPFLFRVQAPLTQTEIARVAQSITLDIAEANTVFVGSNQGTPAQFSNPTAPVVLTVYVSRVAGSTPPPPTAPLTPPPSTILQPTPTVRPSTRIGEATLNFKLHFQGVTKEPLPEYREMNVLVEVQSADESFFFEKTIPVSAAGDGIWKGSVVVPSVPLDKRYAIYLKGAKHLKKKICDKTPSESVPGTYHCTAGAIELAQGAQELNFSQVTLLAGDIPIQNGIIDSVDVVFVRSNFGSSSSQSVIRGDLNFDGVVHAQDLVLMYKALEFKYDEE